MVKCSACETRDVAHVEVRGLPEMAAVLAAAEALADAADRALAGDTDVLGQALAAYREASWPTMGWRVRR